MFARHTQMARELLLPFVRELNQSPGHNGFVLDVVFHDGTKHRFESLSAVSDWVIENHYLAERRDR